MEIQYGLNALPIMGSIGSVYLNFGLWAIALVPAWLVIKEFGVTIVDKKLQREIGEVGLANRLDAERKEVVAVKG